MENISVIDAITLRSSKRKFLNKPVSKEIQEKILDAASMTPSGANMQPWVVYAISNKKVLDNVGNDIIEHIENGGDVDQFIQYYPLNWINPYKKRRITTGAGLYKHLEVNRKDDEKRKELWHDNYRWFGAQTVFFICTDKSLIEGAQGAFIDCGAYMQSLMLAAQAYGIDSCPQGSTTEYGKIIAKTLDLPENLALLYSIVLGYEDTSAIQNTYQPQRAPLEEIVTFID
ncbi:MAG TPA: nitroreductase [Sulfurimonas sp.]|nr:nitroreductase [Sulfurimonas sp.]